jgi:hypothetical protein
MRANSVAGIRLRQLSSGCLGCPSARCRVHEFGQNQSGCGLRHGLINNTTLQRTQRQQRSSAAWHHTSDVDSDRVRRFFDARRKQQAIVEALRPAQLHQNAAYLDSTGVHWVATAAGAYPHRLLDCCVRRTPAPACLRHENARQTHPLATSLSILRGVVRSGLHERVRVKSPGVRLSWMRALTGSRTKVTLYTVLRRERDNCHRSSTFSIFSMLLG